MKGGDIPSGANEYNNTASVSSAGFLPQAQPILVGQVSCCQGTTGNVDGDGGVDIADLTLLIDYLFINFPALTCPAEANIDVDAGIDIADLTYLIDHLFISFPNMPDCP